MKINRYSRSIYHMIIVIRDLDNAGINTEISDSTNTAGDMEGHAK